MDFEPISAARMVVLMVAGGVFATVGLYLMLRPRSHGAAKIELFGLKFESSSAGLLVFLIGAAFLAITLFVPEKVEGPSVGDLPLPKPPIEDHGKTGLPKAPPQGGTEVEPNNSVQTAIPIASDTTISGSLETTRDEIDWYVIDTSGHPDQQIEVGVRFIGGMSTRVTLFDGQEVEQDEKYASDGVARLSAWVDGSSTFYVRIVPNFGSWSSDGIARYEIFHNFVAE